MINFSRKTALVTGGTRGIGKSIVRLLSKFGCKVIYTGTKSSDGKNEKTSYAQLDLLDSRSVKKFISKIKTLPNIDILVNNAGINAIEPIDELKIENWEKVLKVNLTGAMMIMKEVACVMKKSKKGGRILNMSSVFGVISKAKRDSYSASKAGLIGLTKAAALDLAPHKILVNALCPGFTMTDLTRSILSKDEIGKLCLEIPLERFAKEEEMASVAVFLCSDINTYITGQAIIVDGGYSIR